MKDIKDIDYNIDIYSYGLCNDPKCKKIVTPLIKMPKDFFAYSTAKFFKHLLNNKTIKNRKNIIYNLVNIPNEQGSEIFSNKCEHLSFRQINRIFLTKFGALSIKYENYIKYEFISVGEIPKNIVINREGKAEMDNNNNSNTKEEIKN